MHDLGIQNNELAWFRSYLKDRKQFVILNDVNSSMQNISIGVPQGSILGPILFLLYINDLPSASLFTSLLFADDTTLLASGPDINELFNFANNELQKIVHFFRKNKLALHPNKTNYMIFTTSPEVRNTDCNLFINNNNFNVPVNQDLIMPIRRVEGNAENPAVKFLGVHIDPHLNFKHHIKLLCNKVSSSLYFLRSAKIVL